MVDFAKVVSGEQRGGPFVTDDRSFANIIIGRYQAPQPGNKGHYHEEGAEFWLIMLGKIRYKIEGLPEFEAEHGESCTPAKRGTSRALAGRTVCARAVWP